MLFCIPKIERLGELLQVRKFIVKVAYNINIRRSPFPPKHKKTPAKQRNSNSSEVY